MLTLQHISSTFWTCLCFESNYDAMRENHIHFYKTYREDYQTGERRTVVHGSLPSQEGAHFVSVQKFTI